MAELGQDFADATSCLLKQDLSRLWTASKACGKGKFSQDGGAISAVTTRSFSYIPVSDPTVCNTPRPLC